MDDGGWLVKLLCCVQNSVFFFFFFTVPAAEGEILVPFISRAPSRQTMFLG